MNFYRRFILLVILFLISCTSFGTKKEYRSFQIGKKLKSPKSWLDFCKRNPKDISC